MLILHAFFFLLCPMFTGREISSFVRAVGNVPLLIVATTALACYREDVSIDKALAGRQSSVCLLSVILLHCRVDIPCTEVCCYAVIIYPDTLPASTNVPAGFESLIELCFCALDCDNHISTEAGCLPLQQATSKIAHAPRNNLFKVSSTETFVSKSNLDKPTWSIWPIVWP